jgi:hypothetical protein
MGKTSNSYSNGRKKEIATLDETKSIGKVFKLDDRGYYVYIPGVRGRLEAAYFTFAYNLDPNCGGVVPAFGDPNGSDSIGVMEFPTGMPFGGASIVLILKENNSTTIAQGPDSSNVDPASLIRQTPLTGAGNGVAQHLRSEGIRKTTPRIISSERSFLDLKGDFTESVKVTAGVDEHDSDYKLNGWYVYERTLQRDNRFIIKKAGDDLIETFSSATNYLQFDRDLGILPDSFHTKYKAIGPNNPEYAELRMRLIGVGEWK